MDYHHEHCFSSWCEHRLLRKAYGHPPIVPLRVGLRLSRSSHYVIITGRNNLPATCPPLCRERFCTSTTTSTAVLKLVYYYFFFIVVLGTCNPTTAAVVKLCITMSCLWHWTFSHRPQSSLTKHTSTETSVLFGVHSNDSNNTLNVYAKNVTQCYFKTGMTDVVWFLKYFLSGCMHKIRRPVKLPFGVD